MPAKILEWTVFGQYRLSFIGKVIQTLLTEKRKADHDQTARIATGKLKGKGPSLSPSYEDVKRPWLQLFKVNALFKYKLLVEKTD